MARPLIALLTDFGLQDHYVGVMKGVMLGICPDAQLVDITHDIAPQSIVGGVLALDASYPYFPDGTVFLCVVDPGVGSARRGIAMNTGRHSFVGPDNGLLSRVAGGAERSDIVELTSERHRRPTISATFEGRDRFAPAAAWLARGEPLEALGPRVDQIVQMELPTPTVDNDGTISGEVLAIDRFGNLITNIERRLLPDGAVEVSLSGRAIAHLVTTYAEAPVAHTCALVGSSERLEIAVRNGSAAHRFGVVVGAAVQVRRRA